MVPPPQRLLHKATTTTGVAHGTDSLNNLRLILGGPGCGKTTRLLEIVEHELSNGVLPNEIAFVAFTRAAAGEAATRAAAKFSLDAEKDLPWFRTIHSLVYERLGMTREEVLERKDWKEFSEVIGVPVAGQVERDGFFYDPHEQLGDRMLRIVDYANTTTLGLQEAYNRMALEEPLDWWVLEQFDRAYTEFKTARAKMDFTDMLLVYAKEGETCPVKVAIIDEGQDLTRAQWLAVRRAFAKAERVYVGGDDDQAIYQWAGADVEQFLDLHGEIEFLPISYRLPWSIFQLAREVSDRVGKRYRKNFTTDGNRQGSVEYHMVPEGVDISSGTWLLLARNGYQLARLERYARELGVNYSFRGDPAVQPAELTAMRLWERCRAGKVSDFSAKEIRLLLKVADKPVPQLKELQRYPPTMVGNPALPWHEALEGIARTRKDYYIALLRRNEKLGDPRVRIETIHGVKGAEADHVLLMTDLSARTANAFDKDPDSEHRVFYVGVTRARHSLHVIAPQSDRAYPL